MIGSIHLTTNFFSCLKFTQKILTWRRETQSYKQQLRIWTYILYPLWCSLTYILIGNIEKNIGRIILISRITGTQWSKIRIIWFSYKNFAERGEDTAWRITILMVMHRKRRRKSPLLKWRPNVKMLGVLLKINPFLYYMYWMHFLIVLVNFGLHQFYLQLVLGQLNSFCIRKSRPVYAVATFLDVLLQDALLLSKSKLLLPETCTILSISKSTWLQLKEN